MDAGQKQEKAGRRCAARKGRHASCWLMLFCAVSVAQAADRRTGPEMAPSDDGAFVLDVQGGAAWARCVEGMTWSGTTCVGTPLRVNRAGALAYAAARAKASGLQWRLPRTKELQRLASSAARPPGLDPRLFPAAPAGWHWSSTAAISTSAVNPYDYGNIVQGRSERNANRIELQHGWAVNLQTGEARGDMTQQAGLPVRLVLSLD